MRFIVDIFVSAKCKALTHWEISSTNIKINQAKIITCLLEIKNVCFSEKKVSQERATHFQCADDVPHREPC